MKIKAVENILKLNQYREFISHISIRYPKKNAHNSISPLTTNDRFVLACILNVPLDIVKQIEEEFWIYIENPRNRKKYKTSYFTIKNWVRMKIKQGKIQNCTDTEKEMLATQDPATIELIKETFK